MNPFAPIPKPKRGMSRVLHQGGEWLCDNLSLSVTFVGAASLLALRLLT